MKKQKIIIPLRKILEKNTLHICVCLPHTCIHMYVNKICTNYFNS
jgi:hypothetical protein